MGRETTQLRSSHSTAEPSLQPQPSVFIQVTIILQALGFAKGEVNLSVSSLHPQLLASYWIPQVYILDSIAMPQAVSVSVVIGSLTAYMKNISGSFLRFTDSHQVAFQKVPC